MPESNHKQITADESAAIDMLQKAVDTLQLAVDTLGVLVERMADARFEEALGDGRR